MKVHWDIFLLILFSIVLIASSHNPPLVPSFQIVFLVSFLLLLPFLILWAFLSLLLLFLLQLHTVQFGLALFQLWVKALEQSRDVGLIRLGVGVLTERLRRYVGKWLAWGQLIASPIVLLLLPVLPSLSLGLVWPLPIDILIVVLPPEPFGFGLVPAFAEVVVLMIVVALEEVFGEVLFILVLIVFDVVFLLDFVPFVFVVAFLLPFPSILILLIFSIIPLLFLTDFSVKPFQTPDFT